jgi:hypothetical protein
VHADRGPADRTMLASSVPQLLVDVAYYNPRAEQTQQLRTARAAVSVLSERPQRISRVPRVQRLRIRPRLLRNDVSRFCKKLIFKVVQGCCGFSIPCAAIQICALKSFGSPIPAAARSFEISRPQISVSLISD